MFHFTVVMGVQEGRAREEAGRSADGGGRQVAAVETRPLRVLLAEDNPINQKVAARTLERAGHHVALAADGQEALDRLQDGNFDVVLMDVQMPRMDGITATREIRKREAHTGDHVPVLAMTAHAMKGDRERCVEVGMDGYVSKPVKPHELVAAVEDLCAEDHEIGDGAAVEATGGAAGDAGPAFDLEGALENAGGEPEFLCELIGVLSEQADALMAQLRQAMSDDDSEAVMRTAHTIKGAVANFCAARAADVAYRVEVLGKEERLGEAPAAVDALQRELGRLGDELTAYAVDDSGCHPRTFSGPNEGR